MTRRSRRWLAAVTLLAAVATGAILANFALLDAAAGEEPVGKLSPLLPLAGTQEPTGESPASSVPPEPATAEPPIAPSVPASPDDDADDDSHSGHGGSGSEGSEDDRDD